MVNQRRLDDAFPVFAETKPFRPPPHPEYNAGYFRYMKPISNEFVMKTNVLIEYFGRI